MVHQRLIAFQKARSGVSQVPDTPELAAACHGKMQPKWPILALFGQAAKTAPMDGPLAPELLQEVTRRAKIQIRSRMKAIRTGHGRAALEKRSQTLVTRLLAEPRLQAARSVASFWPMEGRGEVDLRALDAALRENGTQLYYPFMDPRPHGGFRTGFRLLEDATELTERGQGFAEPPQDAKVAGPGDVDIVLVPALAVDAYGMRIGYGAGYYDATLGDVCPPAESWIVAYHFQLLAELPAEPHDMPCARIITDERSYEASPRARQQ